MTATEAAKLVAILLAAYPNSKANANTSTVYEKMLCDLDYGAADAAVSRLLATSQFMPSIAEIRKHTVALIAGDIKPGAEAWGELLRTISARGMYRTPGKDFEFADEITKRCVAEFGWSNLCRSENSTADRARFIDLYDQLAANRRRDLLSEGLPAVRRYRELAAAKAKGVTRGPTPLSKLLPVASNEPDTEDDE